MKGQSEAEIQANIVDLLRVAGWLVIVTSQDKATRGQLAGLPDLLAVKNDRTLFIECKTAKGQLRESQERFLAALSPHLGEHVAYLLARSLDCVVEMVGEEI